MTRPAIPTETLYDVRAVNIATSAERIIAERKTLTSAEAIQDMAAGRRGVEVEFFVVVPAGKTWAEAREVKS